MCYDLFQSRRDAVGFGAHHYQSAGGEILLIDGFTVKEGAELEDLRVVQTAGFVNDLDDGQPTAGFDDFAGFGIDVIVPVFERIKIGGVRAFEFFRAGRIYRVSPVWFGKRTQGVARCLATG